MPISLVTHAYMHPYFLTQKHGSHRDVESHASSNSSVSTDDGTYERGRGERHSAKAFEVCY